MTDEEAISVLVSKILDELGYDQEMVKVRQHCWVACNQSSARCYSLVTGSKGEGITKFRENDTDLMCTYLGAVCTNQVMLFHDIEGLIIFFTDRNNIAPGYTRLICAKLSIQVPVCLSVALTEHISGNIYLSSEKWRKYSIKMVATPVRSRNLQQQQEQGPSGPFATPDYGFHLDTVLALMCHCPDILQSWIQRPRRHDWPPAQVIEEISTLEAHVVPVRFKGSPFQFLEWRICFTKAEMKLLKVFNASQIKLFILLKMIAKSSLKPVCKEMTTYVMKNIVLWMTELFPPLLFTEKNLFLSLKKALGFLKLCLLDNNLPSYMIPERNLLANRVSSKSGSGLSVKTRLCAMIDILLHEGRHMLLRCEKIRNA